VEAAADRAHRRELSLRIDYKGRAADRLAPDRLVRVLVVDPAGTGYEAPAWGGGQVAEATFPAQFGGPALRSGAAYLASFWERDTPESKWKPMYAGRFTAAGW
jgi:hypothetical protein